MQLHGSPALLGLHLTVLQKEVGMTNTSVGRSKHRLAPQYAVDKEKAAFADGLAAKLSKAHAGGEFDNLVLAAGLKMLGLLRRALDVQISHSRNGQGFSQDAGPRYAEHFW